MLEAWERRYFEEDPNGGVVATGDGIILACNPAFARIFGFPSTEAARGTDLHELAGIEGQFREAGDRLRAGESIAGDVFEIRRPDGVRMWIRAGISGSLDESGRLVEIRAYLQDVTRSRERERVLEESVELMRFVEAATQDVLWDWDIRRGTLSWSQNGAKRFRYTEEEASTSIEWHTERIHPEDREQVLRSLNAALSGLDTSWHGEYRFRRGDGTYTTVLDRVYIVRGDRGEPHRVIGWMQDISRWREAEEVQRYLARVGAILEAQMDVREALAAVASASVPFMCDRCLIDLVEGSGSLERIVCHPYDAEANGWSLDELPKSGGQSWTGKPTEAAVRRRESLLLHAAPTSEAWTDSHGRPLQSLVAVPIAVGERVFGVLSFLSLDSCRRYMPVDLVVAKEVAQKLAMAVEHSQRFDTAQLASSDREQILRAVAHDLRSPLQALTNSLELAENPAMGDTADRGKWLDIARRAAQQMEHLVDDLLDMSSIQAGQFSVQPVPAVAESMIDSALDLLQPIAESKQLEVRCEVDPELPPVLADVHQFMRVLSNLIGNAVKFTPDGGSIRLGAHRRGDEVEFSVTDTGPGIPPHEIPTVFTQFWRGRRTDRRGVGLGLSIAKGIIEAHGGRIWASSEVGKGTTFFATLPVAFPDEAGRGTVGAAPVQR